MSLFHVYAETASGFETLWTPIAQSSYIEMTFTMGYGRGLVGQGLLQTRHLKPSWSRLWKRDLSNLLRALAFDLGNSSVIGGKALIL